MPLEINQRFIFSRVPERVFDSLVIILIRPVHGFGHAWAIQFRFERKYFKFILCYFVTYVLLSFYT